MKIGLLGRILIAIALGVALGHIKGAGKLLLITVGIAYADTVIAAVLSYTTGTTFLPSLIGNGAQTLDPVEKSAEILPYFTVNIPAALDVMRALVL